jgi:hypothetical protein
VAKTKSKRVTRRRKFIFAAAILGAAATGCVTETTYQTVPPYAAISDEDRVPRPLPPADDSGGVMSSIGDAIMYPFHLIGDAFGSNAH